MVLGAAAAPVAAQAPATPLGDGITLRPLAETRLRYETVDQAGLAEEASAVTARLRAGVEATAGGLSFLAEGEGTLALVEDYNSGTNGLTRFPIVADPENLELNRLQLQYRGLPGVVVTAGRQRINLDDQRFVGASGWRQNEQTFDAVRIEAGKLGPISLDVTYARRVNTIYGREADDLPPGSLNRQSIDGDNVFANAGVAIGPVEARTFAYLVDQDEFGREPFSSQTYGVRASAVVPAGPARLAFTGSYARQSDYEGNPNDYSADYWLAEASASHRGVTLAGGQEVLGADDGTALTSFQTPLATLHKFNGWADKFVTTPADGLRDLYVSLRGVFKTAPVPGLNAALAWHRFTSDRADRDYGTEWNGQIGFTIRRARLLAKYAHYEAESFATDTDKFWLQIEWTL